VRGRWRPRWPRRRARSVLTAPGRTRAGTGTTPHIETTRASLHEAAGPFLSDDCAVELIRGPDATRLPARRGRNSRRTRRAAGLNRDRWSRLRLDHELARHQVHRDAV